jgi:hypothetical protein
MSTFLEDGQTPGQVSWNVIVLYVMKNNEQMS